MRKRKEWRASEKWRGVKEVKMTVEVEGERRGEKKTTTVEQRKKK